MKPIPTILLAAALLAAPLTAQHEGHGQKPEAKPSAAAPVVLQAQTTCPISGELLAGGEDEVAVVYEGQQVRLCCAKCVKKFQEFPDAALFGMFQAGQKPANVQTTCPVSGEELGADAVSFWVLNKEIKLCCKKCLAKVEKDPAAWFDQLEGRTQQTHCPVMGGEIDPEVFSVIQGQKVFHCCPGCIKKLAAEPDKYFAEAAAQKVVFAAASDLCPVTGETVENPNWWVSYQGRRYHFCCQKCIASFVKDPKKHLVSA